MPHVLRFKFLESSEPAARTEFVRRLTRRGDVRIKRLFPDEEDAELATLYTAHFRRRAVGAALLRLLRRSPLIEFVEGDVERRLAK